ncbi:MAG: hypothetical protein COZ02_01270 [Zetaproteobacteria bacterium CG_4_10_14_0_8_um_filter_59_127]|nr:MAG: hypothetical protein COZ02_01270 [Zetaproteobacteria bacterium CG_4_10_14_0_8_um_filter_59_127]
MFGAGDHIVVGVIGQVTGDHLDLAGDAADMPFQCTEKGVAAFDDLPHLIGVGADVMQAVCEIAALATLHGIGDLPCGMADGGGELAQRIGKHHAADSDEQQGEHRQQPCLAQLVGQIDLHGKTAQYCSRRHMMALQAVASLIVSGL